MITIKESESVREDWFTRDEFEKVKSQILTQEELEKQYMPFCEDLLDEMKFVYL